MKGKSFTWAPDAPPPVLQAHSRRKLDLLRRYIRKYLATLARTPRQDRLTLTFIDGFAGGGTFTGAGGEIVDGTPLIMLEEVERARRDVNVDRRKSLLIDASFVFVEKNRDTFEHLRRVLADRGWIDRLGPNGALVRGDMLAQMQTIRERVRKGSPRAARAIWLLDQCGWNAVPLTVIRDLMAMGPGTEIVLTFAIDGLLDYLTLEPAFLKAAEGVGLARSDVLQLRDMKSGAGGRVLAQQVIAGHIKAETAAPYFTPFFARSDAAHRDMWIVHLSHHPKARDVMLDQHYGEANALVHQGPGGLSMVGWDQNLDQLLLDSFGFDVVDVGKMHHRLLEELPGSLWHDGLNDGLQFERWRAGRANGTAATRDQMVKVLHELAGYGEIVIETATGRTKRPGAMLKDDDVLRTPAQGVFLTGSPGLLGGRR